MQTNVPSNTPKELEITFSVTAAKDNLVQWLVNANNVSNAIQIDWEKPTLQYVIDGNTSYPANDNVITIGTAGTASVSFTFPKS